MSYKTSTESPNTSAPPVSGGGGGGDGFFPSDKIILSATTNLDSSQAEKYIEIDTNNSSMNLPTAVGIEGTNYFFHFYDNGSNNINVTTSGSETVGNSSAAYIPPSGSMHVRSNGTDWDIISQFGGTAVNAQDNSSILSTDRILIEPASGSTDKDSLHNLDDVMVAYNATYGRVPKAGVGSFTALLGFYHVITQHTSGSAQITIPSAVGQLHKRIIFKMDSYTNTQLYDLMYPDTAFNGAVDAVNPVWTIGPGSYLVIESDGTDWMVIVEDTV